MEAAPATPTTTTTTSNKNSCPILEAVRSAFSSSASTTSSPKTPPSLSAESSSDLSSHAAATTPHPEEDSLPAPHPPPLVLPEQQQQQQQAKTLNGSNNSKAPRTPAIKRMHERPAEKHLGPVHAFGLGLAAALAAVVDTVFFAEPATTSILFTAPSALLRHSAVFVLCALIVWALFLWTRWMFFLRETVTTPAPRSIPVDPRLLKSATAIAADLRAGLYSSVDITKACIAHVQRVDTKHVNAVVYTRFDAALQEAATADRVLEEYRRSSSNSSNSSLPLLPPFLGVPCSIKETFKVGGGSSCVGHPARWDIIHSSSDDDDDHDDQDDTNNAAMNDPSESPCVARYRNAGFVPIIGTSVSELAMWLESSTFAHGITANIHDASRIVGGSSGGEGAALAACYAPVALGGSFLGSLQLPSFFCGTFTHKPSTRLTPNFGQYPCVSGPGHNIAVVGPMSRHCEDLYPVLQVLARGGSLLPESHLQLNAPCPPVADPRARIKEIVGSSSSNNNKQKKPFTVFYTTDLNIPGITVSAEQQQAVRQVAEALKTRCGIENVVEIDLCSSKNNNSITNPFPADFGGFSTVKHIIACASANEQHFCDLLSKEYQQEGQNFNVFTEMGKWLLGLSNHTFPAIALGCVETALHALEDKEEQRAQLAAAKRLSDKMTELLQDAVLIAPTMPTPAPKHSALELLSLSFMYTAVFNALQLPSTCVPVWLPGEEKQVLPCGVQIVSGWGCDVNSLAVANLLSDKAGDLVYCKTPSGFSVSE